MDMKTSPLALLKDPTLLKTDALINGQWVKGASRFDVNDPSSGNKLADRLVAERPVQKPRLVEVPVEVELEAPAAAAAAPRSEAERELLQALRRARG